jgi:hypothetical protein
MLTNYQPVLFVRRLQPASRQIENKADQRHPPFHLVDFADWRLFRSLRFLVRLLVLALFALARLSYDVFVLDDITDTSLLLFLFAFNTGMLTLLADMIDKRASG